MSVTTLIVAIFGGLLLLAWLITDGDDGGLHA